MENEKSISRVFERMLMQSHDLIMDMDLLMCVTLQFRSIPISVATDSGHLLPYIRIFRIYRFPAQNVLI